MGHSRLGDIPKTRKWQDVVAYLADPTQTEHAEHNEADPKPLAKAVLSAAEGALNNLPKDRSIQEVFYLLTRTALAARENDWVAALQSIGVQPEGGLNPATLTAAFVNRADDVVARLPSRSDFGEISIQAAGEALVELVGMPEQRRIFAAEESETGAALKAVSTKAGFSELGHRFFANFLGRFLNFYLSRITASHVGGSRIRNTAELAQFNEALKLHSRQSAEIVRDFCGEWFSKANWKEGINPENTSRFLAHCFSKLRDELGRQGGKQ